MDLIAGLLIWWFIIKKKTSERHKNFKRNGGLLLQQQLFSNYGAIEKTRIFSANELKKATDNFIDKNIIGQGGQGTVYKGVIDTRVVAIKKSKNVGDLQSAQFINEVVILSQINHRNVVKLLGCCLETEVPLLVYEFITNGTLAEHLHNSTKEFRISWKMRLQIAAESAGAVAYLHSFSSVPIYHRDIKSSNILLDEKYNAKVSDFGISRTIGIEQTHLTTQVQGTFGYLDPEYFHSSQFSEKSDVYSFGVVLIELLTSMKPIYTGSSNEMKSLKVEFLSAMENSCLPNMLDPQVLREAEKDELATVALLARDCLNVRGEDRPSMKEVSMALEGLRSYRGASSKQEMLLEGNYATIYED